MYNRSSNGGEQTKTKIMKTSLNEMTMLQYQIKRYRAMGNGVMTQRLTNKLQKLLAKS